MMASKSASSANEVSMKPGRLGPPVPQLTAHVYPRMIPAPASAFSRAEANVEHRDMRADREHPGECLPGVGRLPGYDDVRFGVQQVAHPSAYHHVVVRDEHPQVEGRAVGWAHAALRQRAEH